MNQFQEQSEHSHQEEINGLNKELEQDIKARDLAEKIVEQENADIHRIEEKIESLKNLDIELFVNAELKNWHNATISYHDVVVLAYGKYEDIENITYAVDYSHGPSNNQEGILDKNQSVNITNKMRFRVKKANRS